MATTITGPAQRDALGVICDEFARYYGDTFRDREGWGDDDAWVCPLGGDEVADALRDFLTHPPDERTRAAIAAIGEGAARAR